MTKKILKPDYLISLVMLCSLFCAGYVTAQPLTPPQSGQSTGAAVDDNNSIDKKLKGPVKLQPLVATSPPTDKSKHYSSAGRNVVTVPKPPSKDKFQRYSSVSITIKYKEKEDKGPIKIIIPPKRPDQDDPDYPETSDDEPALGEDVVVADIEKKLRAIPPIPSNIKQYLEDKYVRLDDLPSVRLQEIPNYGQQIEHISISGDITPKDAEKAAKFKKAKSEVTTEDRARALVRAFLEEEVDLLGIIDINEIKETKMLIGWSPPDLQNKKEQHLYYQREIGNLEMENSEIHIVIDPNGEAIRYVSAAVVPATPELYHAAKRKTLSKEKIYNIIKREMKSTKPDLPVAMQIVESKKVAIPKPPYIIWQVRAGRVAPLVIIKSSSPQGIRAPLPGEEDAVSTSWDYRIDAFTGEILSKQSTIRW